MLDENTDTVHYSLMLNRDNPYKNSFFTKVDQIVSSGIAQKLDEKQNRANVLEIKDQGAVPLTMDHLGICFALILVCLGLSCAVFVIERIIK
jgi:hypothetical protein